MEKRQEIIASNSLIDFNNKVNIFLTKLRNNKIIHIKYITKDISYENDDIYFHYYAFIIYQF